MFPAINTPRVGVCAVVLVGYRTVFFEGVDLRDAVAPTELPGTTGIGAGTVLVDRERVVDLLVLRGHRSEERPPGVAIQPIAARPSRNPAIENFEHLEVVAVRINFAPKPTQRKGYEYADRTLTIPTTYDRTQS